MTADPDLDRPLTSIVDRVGDITKEGQVSLDRVVGAFEKTGFATMLIVPAAAVVTPLSGIPLFSSLCGVTICLIAAQWLMKRDRVWLPHWLGQQSLEGDKVRVAMNKLRPAARWLDKYSRARARFLFRQPLRALLPLSCLLFGALMPFLELVPFSSSLLGASVCLIAFSLLTRDGFFALAALLPLAIVVWALTALF
jgi:hypothetical protein